MAADHVDLLIREFLMMQLIRIAVMMLRKPAYFFSLIQKKSPSREGR
ncbi:hypothetical protein [Undibacterium curvum]